MLAVKTGSFCLLLFYKVCVTIRFKKTARPPYRCAPRDTINSIYGTGFVIDVPKNMFMFKIHARRVKRHTYYYVTDLIFTPKDVFKLFIHHLFS